MEKGRPVPSQRLVRQVDAVARAILPGALTATLQVVAVAAIGLPGAVAGVCLPAVFFWSLFRPGAMPPPVVFGLGLLQDLLSAAPIGAGLLPLLILHGLAARWRALLARQSFLLVWLAFCGLAAGAMALSFALESLLSWQLPPAAPGFAQLGLAIGLYPAIAWPMSRLHEAMRRAESAP